MSALFILAQTGKAAENLDYSHVDYGTRYVLQALDELWWQITALNWLPAVLAIAFGVIPLMYGWRIYKTLTVIGLALLGLYVGLWVGEHIEKVLLCSIIGAVLFGVLALPLIRWAVSVLGAIAGGIIAAGIWHACYLPEQFVWAGALVGIVAGGMISFVVFKLSVMLFTSFGGASLIIVGAFSLIYRYETFLQDPPTTHLNHLYYNYPWFLPLLLIVSTLIGVIIQFKFVSGSKDWSI